MSSKDGLSARLIIFVNSLGLGGTEKAACSWATLLNKCSTSNQIKVLTLEDGPRRKSLAECEIPIEILGKNVSPEKLAESISQAQVIHAHAPGFPHQGDILGAALKLLDRKIPVVQTNIFGQLRNPSEEHWTSFRLFISWTSCVQAARRSGRKLNPEFFRRQSVASYPLDSPTEEQLVSVTQKSCDLRKRLGLASEDVLFGRFSRPEPNKWTPIVLDAFLKARKHARNIRLLLQEPPAEVTQKLVETGMGLVIETESGFSLPSLAPVIIIRATSDSSQLMVNQTACDVVLHTSSIGESFGYGLAEPMVLGKPVISNSVPWHDQAQIELVRHKECGFIASTAETMRAAIESFARNPSMRQSYGKQARGHILSIANSETSKNRLVSAFNCAIDDMDNPHAEEDLEKALLTAEYLDKNQWGHVLSDRIWLHRKDLFIRFLSYQRRLRDKFDLDHIKKSLYQ